MDIQLLHDEVRLVYESLVDGDVAVDTNRLFYAAANSPNILDLVEWKRPEIQDLSDLLELRQGKVIVVRLDRICDGLGHKIPVVGGLILRSVSRAVIRNRRFSGIVDAGNVSSGLAMGHFAEKLGLKAVSIMSRHFPRDVLEFVRKNGNGRLAVEVAPSLDTGIEREFYEYLVHRAKQLRASGFECLWHAKYGGHSVSPFGQRFAEALRYEPSYVVLSLGAGTTLEGIVSPVLDRFQGRPIVTAVEHELSPLLELPADVLSLREQESSPLNDVFRRPPVGVPHTVIGPHFDDLNPLLSNRALSRIKLIVRYSDCSWRRFAQGLYDQGCSFGNSSCVNLMAAKFLAEQTGRTALTFAYEPLRPFYLSTGAERKVVSHVHSMNMT